jgi:hypothetical protein
VVTTTRVVVRRPAACRAELRRRRRTRCEFPGRVSGVPRGPGWREEPGDGVRVEDGAGAVHLVEDMVTHGSLPAKRPISMTAHV